MRKTSYFTNSKRYLNTKKPERKEKMEKRLDAKNEAIRKMIDTKEKELELKKIKAETRLNKINIELKELENLKQITTVYTPDVWTTQLDELEKNEE